MHDKQDPPPSPVGRPMLMKAAVYIPGSVILCGERFAGANYNDYGPDESES
jgi:hypothetical protein